MPHVLSPRRSTFWLLAALLFGLLLLPFLVHLTGDALLGEYSGGGAGAFFADYLSGLLSFHWHSWALVLGPPLIVVFWRILVLAPSGKG